MLREALIDAHGEEEGNRLFRAYGDAIPVGYQEQVPARAAVPDIDRLDRLARGETDLTMSLYRPLEQRSGQLCFKLARGGEGIALSDVLPVLENMGLRVLQEQLYEFATRAGASFWMHDFRLEPLDADDLEPDRVERDFRGRFRTGLARRSGERRLQSAGPARRAELAPGDGPARLLQIPAPDRHPVQPGLHGADADAESRPSPASSPSCSRRASIRPVPRIARPLLGALEARFRADLDGVANLDQDRILRRYLRLMLATLRTNYYQPGARRARPTSPICRSRSTRPRCPTCRCRGRLSRSSSTRRAPRACICAAARSRAAASAGRTAARTSAPRSSA